MQCRVQTAEQRIHESWSWADGGHRTDVLLLQPPARRSRHPFSSGPLPELRPEPWDTRPAAVDSGSAGQAVIAKALWMEKTLIRMWPSSAPWNSGTASPLGCFYLPTVMGLTSRVPHPPTGHIPARALEGPWGGLLAAWTFLGRSGLM